MARTKTKRTKVKPTIVVVVDGGVVQGVLCNTNANVIVLDYDEAEENDDVEAMEKTHKSHSKTLKTVY